MAINNARIENCWNQVRQTRQNFLRVIGHMFPALSCSVHDHFYSLVLPKGCFPWRCQRWPRPPVAHRPLNRRLLPYQRLLASHPTWPSGEMSVVTKVQQEKYTASITPMAKTANQQGLIVFYTKWSALYTFPLPTFPTIAISSPCK